MMNNHPNGLPVAELVGKVGLHDHLCLIYETQEEQLSSAIPFIKIGLERGEKCVHIADANTAATLMSAMREHGINVDAAVCQGGLTITNKGIYPYEGDFDPDRWIKIIEGVITEAKSAAFSTLRLTAEMTWVVRTDPRPERLIEFEAKFNHLADNHNILAICYYDERAFHPEVMLDILRTHPTVVYHGSICKNPYYVPPDEFLRPQHKEREVQRMLARMREDTENIEKLQQSEQRIRRAYEEIKVLKHQLYNENLALREEIDRASMFEEIIGSSAALQPVLSGISRVAPTDSTVLITGETGTGKELVARAIHKHSQRGAHAFVSVNCAAIPASLIASELFGHERGAFTGAQQRRLGRFELAERGTIFLDEIGDLPSETQIALLRVLQEREFERVGGTQLISTDVRVIAATNRDLKAAIAAGSFRTDLFYRLNVFPISVPPLRERPEDIATLVEYFINRYASNAGKRITSIEKRTLELLQSYRWPGNIRELQNVIERSVILCDRTTLSVDERWLSTETSHLKRTSRALTEQVGDHERRIIEAALSQSRGRVAGPSGAAARLGIPPSTLENKIRALGISKNRFRSS
jgi:DNA-binding NtrC family response regulator